MFIFRAKALNGTQNFFLGVGFYKPHLPLVFPEEYLTNYQNVELPPAGDCDVPNNFPPISWSSCGTLCGNSDIIDDGVDCNDYENSSMSDAKTKELRSAYFA